MRLLTLFFLTLLCTCARAQTSRHSLSYRIGWQSVERAHFNERINVPDLSFGVSNPNAVTAVLRYRYQWKEGLSIYVGAGLEKHDRIVEAVWILQPDDFFQPSEANRVLRHKFRSPLLEAGFDIIRPVHQRWALVLATGLQFSKPRKMGTTSGHFEALDSDGRSRRFVVATFHTNRKGELFTALVVAPGIRWQPTEKVFLTVRGTVLRSSQNFITDGEVWTQIDQEIDKRTTTFHQPYNYLGTELEVSYVF